MPAVIRQRHRAIRHRHLPRAYHLIAVAQTTDGTVPDGDQETFGGHGRVTQHLDHRILQTYTTPVSGR